MATPLRFASATALIAILGAGATTSSGAQAYPVKPVRLLIGASPGGGVDIIGRVFASGLSQALNQQVIVDNRPGGQSNIAAEIAARSDPDGHTLFGVTFTHALNASLYRDLRYDLTKDFAAVTNLASTPHVVVVNPQLTVKSIGDLVRMAQARPGAVNYSSAGPGTAAFLAAETFKSRANVNLTHVPYRGGGQALAAVVSGEVSVMFASIAGTQPFVQQGRMRALAVTSLHRAPLVPDLPTVAESGLPGYESGTWFGLMVPARTPRPTVEAIRNASVAVVKGPDNSKRLVELGYVIIGDRPEQFAAYVKSEVQKLAKIVKEQRLTPD